MSEQMNTSANKPTPADLGKSYVRLMGELQRKVSMEEVARDNGIGLADLREHVAEETDLFAAFARWADTELAKNVVLDATMPKRERVLDILMERFEIMRPYKKGLEVLSGFMKKDITYAARANCVASRSMGWVLTLSGQNPRGLLRDGLRQGLVFAYARAMKVWFHDEEPDMARTMATLDKELRRGEDNLKRIEKVMKCLPKPPSFRKRRRPATGEQAI